MTNLYCLMEVGTKRQSQFATTGYHPGVIPEKMEFTLDGKKYNFQMHKEDKTGYSLFVSSGLFHHGIENRNYDKFGCSVDSYMQDKGNDKFFEEVYYPFNAELEEQEKLLYSNPDFGKSFAQHVSKLVCYDGLEGDLVFKDLDVDEDCIIRQLQLYIR